MLRQTLATLRQSKDEGAWEIANVESLLGACSVGRGDYREAESLLIESYRILDKIRGPETTYTRKALERIVDLYQRWGKPTEVDRFRRLLLGS